MKKISIILLVLILSIACNSQQNNKMNNLNKQIQTIDRSEIPFYTLRFNHTMCFIDIRINDLPLIKNSFVSESSQQYKYINHLLTSDDEQRITIRIYPLTKHSFDQNTSFSIELSQFKSKEDWDNGNFDAQSILVNYESDKDVNLKRNPIIGKNYYEKELIFNSNNVNINFPKRKILTDINNNILKEKLFKKYNTFIKSVSDKNKEIYDEYLYQNFNYLQLLMVLMMRN